MEGFTLNFPILISHSHVLSRIEGEDDFMSRADELLKPTFYELMCKTAHALNSAGLMGVHLLQVEVIVHAQPENDNV